MGPTWAAGGPGEMEASLWAGGRHPENKHLSLRVSRGDGDPHLGAGTGRGWNALRDAGLVPKGAQTGRAGVWGAQTGPQPTLPTVS